MVMANRGRKNMATGKLCIRSGQEEMAEWTDFFLNDLKTKQQSLVYVKRMMAVAVSYITYLRGIFPEEAYRSKYLEDLCIKVLHENCNTAGASKVVKWMMGCFDALEKQYLQIVFIGVYTNPDEPNCIIESYQFKFRYTEKGPEINIHRNNEMEMQVMPGEIKRASVVLIRKLFLLMQNMDTLPNNVYLTMKLYYYDAITPADYQPPGFKEGESDSLWFEGRVVHFKVGQVQTGLHTLTVGVSAEQGRLEKLQLQKCNHLRETNQSAQMMPPKPERIKDSCEKTGDEEDLPSEDESAQFKKPKGRVVKRKVAAKTLARKKRRI